MIDPLIVSDFSKFWIDQMVELVASDSLVGLVISDPSEAWTSSVIVSLVILALEPIVLSDV